ncbi:unnamed protein product, partial [Tilletia caries]
LVAITDTITFDLTLDIAFAFLLNIDLDLF